MNKYTYSIHLIIVKLYVTNSIVYLFKYRLVHIFEETYKYTYICLKYLPFLNQSVSRSRKVSQKLFSVVLKETRKQNNNITDSTGSSGCSKVMVRNCLN